MMELLLQYRLIKLLGKHNRKNNAPNRECFVDYVTDKCRHKCFYYFDSRHEYRNRIDSTLGDCIAPLSADVKESQKYYAAYDEDRVSLLVTSKGREFTTWFGFVENFLKHHARTKKLLPWTLSTLAALFYLKLIWGLIIIHSKSVWGFIKEFIEKVMGLFV